MQGTMVMLLALGGLGCTHGHDVHYDACYDACYSPTAYGGAGYDACYSPTAYGGAGYDACYSPTAYGGACYDACYSACYEPRHGRGLFDCLRDLCDGLFGHLGRRHACYDACYDACYSAGYDACYSGYAPPIHAASHQMPVYGTYTPAVSPQGAYAAPQGAYAAPQGAVHETPTKAAPQATPKSAPQVTPKSAPQSGYGSGQRMDSTPATESGTVAPEATEPGTVAPEAAEPETTVPDEEAFEQPIEEGTDLFDEAPESLTPPADEVPEPPNT